MRASALSGKTAISLFHGLIDAEAGISSEREGDFWWPKQEEL